MYNKTNGK